MDDDAFGAQQVDQGRADAGDQRVSGGEGDDAPVEIGQQVGEAVPQRRRPRQPLLIRHAREQVEMALAAEHDAGPQDQALQLDREPGPAVGADPDDGDGVCGWTGGVRHEVARYRHRRHEVPQRLAHRPTVSIGRRGESGKPVKVRHRPAAVNQAPRYEGTRQVRRPASRPTNLFGTASGSLTCHSSTHFLPSSDARPTTSTTWAWPSSSPRSPRRSVACWCAARRARPSRPPSARWRPCCRPSTSMPTTGSRSIRPTRRRPRPTARSPSTPNVQTRPVRLVELPVGATEDRVLGSLHLERALSHGKVEYEPGLLAARPPRDPLRRRGQPAPRPPRRPAARCGGDGAGHDRARRGLGRARRAVRADRHHEPRGGRAPAAAARPVRPDGRGRGTARACAARRGRTATDGLRRRSGRLHRPLSLARTRL